MGYQTDFSGAINIDKPLTTEQIEYIKAFSLTRRVKRDVAELWRLHTGKHGLPGSENVYGLEGEYFAMDDGNYGQTKDSSVIDFNRPPQNQPGLWCGWTLNEDGTAIVWNEGEKFYNYIEWMQYIIENFFIPWGCILSGEMEWHGESIGDHGTIIVNHNQVTTLK